MDNSPKHVNYTTDLDSFFVGHFVLLLLYLIFRKVPVNLDDLSHCSTKIIIQQHTLKPVI